MTDIRPVTADTRELVLCPKSVFGKRTDNCQVLFKESLAAAKEDLGQVVARGECPSRDAAYSAQHPDPVALFAPTTTATSPAMSDSSAGDTRTLTFTDQEGRKLVVEAPTSWVGLDGRTVVVPDTNGSGPTRYNLPEIFRAFAAVSGRGNIASVRFLQGRSCEIYQGNMRLGPTWLIGQQDPQGHDSLTVLPTKRPASSWAIGAWFSLFSDRETLPHAVVVEDPERASR
jgi:hypothetical protein